MLLGSQCAGGLEHLLGAGTDSEVIGEVDPANCAGGVDEEFGGAGDVMPIDAGTFMEQVVAADQLGVRIRQKRVRVTGLTAEVLRF